MRCQGLISFFLKHDELFHEILCQCIQVRQPCPLVIVMTTLKILQGAHYNSRRLNELQSLAESAGYTVVDSIEQVRKPNPRYQIGSGKAEGLAELVANKKIEKTIFDNELRPIQVYNLAKITGVEVVDRFQLILEIFAQRASTSEARLQIKLAKLRYELPRAREKVRLARMSEQPGFMGLGKYEVDIYYETIRRQIYSIRDKLKRIRKKRQLHRVGRKGGRNR